MTPPFRSWLALPTPLSDNGPRIIFQQINFKPQEFSTLDICKYICTMCEILMLRDPYACIQGLVGLIDLGKATMEHLPMLNLTIIKEMIVYIEKAIPLRTKAIYLVNCPSVLEQIVKTLMPCMSDKLRNRL